MKKLKPVSEVVFDSFEKDVFEREDLLTQDRTNTLKAIEEVIEGRKKSVAGLTYKHEVVEVGEYNQALQDLKEDITKLFTE